MKPFHLRLLMLQKFIPLLNSLLSALPNTKKQL